MDSCSYVHKNTLLATKRGVHLWPPYPPPPPPKSTTVCYSIEICFIQARHFILVAEKDIIYGVVHYSVLWHWKINKYCHVIQLCTWARLDNLRPRISKWYGQLNVSRLVWQKKFALSTGHCQKNFICILFAKILGICTLSHSLTTSSTFVMGPLQVQSTGQNSQWFFTSNICHTGFEHTATTNQYWMEFQKAQLIPCKTGHTLSDSTLG